jgi:membrane-associated protein
MNFFTSLIELLKDPRTAIAGWIAMGIGPTLFLIFLILFIETGLVFTPFLPGDSLLFAAGYFAHDPRSGLALWMVLLIAVIAPILGDECNYFIGRFFGRKIIASGKVKAMTPERIDKTSAMIEKWGPLAVFLGRFFPIIRTFMPFISGMSGMKWHRFAPFSVLGGFIWGTLFTLLGFFFGGIPFVQQHFELVIVLILVISLLPTIIGLVKGMIAKHQKSAETVAEAEQGQVEETLPEAEEVEINAETETAEKEGESGTPPTNEIID